MKITHMRARGGAVRSVIAASLLGLLASWGAGCGQRGPLYIPDSEPAAGEEAAAENAAQEGGQAGEQQAADQTEGEEQE